MNNNTRASRRVRVVSIAGLALASVGTAAAAADSNSTAATTPAAKVASPAAPNPAAEDAKLAKALSVSTDKLKAARASLQSDELAAAVKAGRLTDEQQGLIERLRDSGLDFPLPPGVAPAPGSGDDPDTALAKKLGISVSKLRDARPALPAGGPPAPGVVDPPAPGGTTPSTKTR